MSQQSEHLFPVDLAVRLRERVDFGVLAEWATAMELKTLKALAADMDETATARLRGKVENFRLVKALGSKVEEIIALAAKKI